MDRLINLNADIAEGFGTYDIGNDAGLMDIVASANVACGFHGGDARTMQRIVMPAKERGVSIGAHPGFNDPWGFGRWQIRMDTAELEYMVASQIGAVLRDPQAVAKQAVRLAMEGEVVTISGKVLKVEAETPCIHGDEPTAVAVGTAVKAALEAAGAGIATLPEMTG